MSGHRSLWLAGAVVAVAFNSAAAEKYTYPKTTTVDHSDQYHGTTIADPYRWLEEDVRTSERVADWVSSQNEVTFAYLKGIPERETIKERLTELWNYEKFGSPFKVGGRYYYYKNDGLQNQFVLYMMDTLDSEPRVLFDPNSWSDDGTVSLGGTSFSDCGKYVAYAIRDAGSDWTKWKIRNITTGEDLPETLNWIKFSGLSWTNDSKGFFYSRYDTPAEGQEFQALNKFQKVFYHRIGTPQSEDTLVYKRDDQPDWGFGAGVSEDGRYLIISTWVGTDNKNRLTYRDLEDPYAMPIDIIDEFTYEYSFIGNDGPIFFVQTDLDAPKRRVIAIDIRNPAPENWTTLIPESDDTLQGVGITGNMFVASYLHDACTRVRMFDLKGNHVRDVQFPTLGSAGGFGGRMKDTETFYSFSSFSFPPSIYRYDMITGKSELLRQASVDFEPNNFEVSQVFYSSKDGTRVPMFICHKKGIKMDGNNPTLLYGYGGFDISLTPGFSITRLAWMEMGGVFAMPNLRGGGEYGQEWHIGGKLKNKQNVFDDFIAAAEYLIESGYTKPEKLAIQGGSNGGLLVGACMTQRPELFGACLPAVGVMDMLRFHTFTAGRFWVDEYGSADDPEMFPVLLKYSPYHNIKKGVKYPATMVTTADYDDRVVPGHSFKFAAALQAAHKGDAPVMIRIEERAGHGAGTPTAKQIEQTADAWAFLADNLNMEIPPHYR